MTVTQGQAFMQYVEASGGNATQALLDFAARAQIAVAWLDRETIERHLERKLSDAEWSELVVKLDKYDQHVSEYMDVQEEFIVRICREAGVEHP